MDRVPPDKLSSLPSEYVRVNYKVNGIRIQYPGRGNDAQRLIEEIQMACKPITKNININKMIVNLQKGA